MVSSENDGFPLTIMDMNLVELNPSHGQVMSPLLRGDPPLALLSRRDSRVRSVFN